MYIHISTVPSCICVYGTTGMKTAMRGRFDVSALSSPCNPILTELTNIHVGSGIPKLVLNIICEKSMRLALAQYLHPPCWDALTCIRLLSWDSGQ